MRPSPNREHLIFLAAGGIIFLLILAVVVFNMMRDPTRMVEEDVAFKRPSVALDPALQAGARVGGGEGREGWAEEDRQFGRGRPAPVFRPVDESAHSATGRTEVEAWHAPEESGQGSDRGSGGATFVSPPPKPVEVATPPEQESPAAAPGTAAMSRENLPARGVVPPKESAPARSEPSPPSRVESVAARVEPAAVVPPSAVARSGALPAAVSRGGYVIRLGAFSQQENAGRVEKRVTALGLPVYQQELLSNGRKLWRVSSGPYGTRDDADKVARHIKEKTSLSGSVVSAPQ